MRISDWSSDVCSSDLPGLVLTQNGVPALAHLTDAGQQAVVDVIKEQSPLQAVDGLNIQPIETAGSIENKELRQREKPYLMPLIADTVRAVEQASYDGAYKGVTEILTLYQIGRASRKESVCPAVQIWAVALLSYKNIMFHII